jgi:cyclopropane fatty-acyl-phospholipid synthase-like methyltransferase
MQEVQEIEMMNYKDHWNKAYARVNDTQLGWYESDVSSSIRLIKKAGIGPGSRLLSVGAGNTTLIDTLLEHGYDNLLATDISEVALHGLQTRIGNLSHKVEWIVDDLTNSTLLKKIPPVDLWIDRAVLHFFTKEAEQMSYFKLLNSLVHKYGYVILAEFNQDSAEKCSGLPVHRYSADMLHEKLGANYNLITSFDYEYTMPSGDLRTYVYTLFQKIG